MHWQRVMIVCGSPAAVLAQSGVCFVRVVALAVVWFAYTPAFAHPEGFSGLHVTISPERMRAAITLHTRDLGGWFPPGTKHPDYVADVTREMERTVDEIIEVQVDGEPLPVVKVRAFLLEVGLIEIDIDYATPATRDRADGSSANGSAADDTFDGSDAPVELLVWSKHLIEMPRGHQQLLFIEDRRELTKPAVNAGSDSPASAPDSESSSPSGDARGVMRLEDVLTVERDAGVTTLPTVLVAEIRGTKAPSVDTVPESSGAESTSESSGAKRDSAKTANDHAVPNSLERKPKPSTVAAGGSPSRISFFRFGVEHIITGYDHLLFLAALLLVCATFHEAATIITCFTIAHSITLALAALDVVRLPAEVVEPAIALTIVYVAIENMTGLKSLWRRAAITCGFGLIHGLGFASALRDIGLGTIPGGVAWPLLQFNLGVEAGQLCVAAVILPLLLWVRRKEDWSRRVAFAGSLAVALLGGYWLTVRVVSQFTAL